MQEALTCRQVAEQHPNHEIVHVHYHLPVMPDYPNGFEAALMIPRDKIAQAAHPPFWRHGQTIHINPVPPTGLGR